MRAEFCLDNHTVDEEQKCDFFDTIIRIANNSSSLEPEMLVTNLNRQELIGNRSAVNIAYPVEY